MVVSQNGEEKFSHNEKNYNTSTLEDAYQHFLTQQRDILINDIIKRIVCESEVEPSYDCVNKELIFEDDVTSMQNENLLKAFSFVAKKRRINALADKSYDNLILKAMSVMKLKIGSVVVRTVFASTKR